MNIMTFHFKTCIYFEERCPLPLGYNNGSYTASLPKKEKICWTSIYSTSRVQTYDTEARIHDWEIRFTISVSDRTWRNAIITSSYLLFCWMCSRVSQWHLLSKWSCSSCPLASSTSQRSQVMGVLEEKWFGQFKNIWALTNPDCPSRR